MENEKLIQMLNRDIADEHAAIIRYLVHSYLKGKTRPWARVFCHGPARKCGTCTGWA
ncbi:MAG: hypothetical protein R2875_17855 [Desulfobacterales bacterium]